MVLSVIRRLCRAPVIERVPGGCLQTSLRNPSSERVVLVVMTRWCETARGMWRVTGDIVVRRRETTPVAVSEKTLDVIPT